MVENDTVRIQTFWEFRGNVDYVDKWFLMSTPVPILMIWITYLTFVLKIGPSLMKNRAPFKLNNVLLLYNALQVILSLFVVYVATRILLQNGFFLQSRCISDKEDMKKNVTVVIYYYFFAKMTELLDTVFFVLRKKDRQITFLHVYHHSITLLCSWFTLKYEPSYSTIFLGTINSFVHILMYAYYGLSTFPELSKYLWWKKYITTMQLIQFLLIVLQVTINYKFSICRPSYILFGAIIFNVLLFMFLFSDFYIKSYIKNNQKEASYAKEELYSRNTDHGTDNNGMIVKNELNNHDLHTHKFKGKRC